MGEFVTYADAANTGDGAEAIEEDGFESGAAAGFEVRLAEVEFGDENAVLAKAGVQCEEFAQATAEQQGADQQDQR